MTDYAMPTTEAGRALFDLAPKLWKQREGDEPRMTPVQIEVRRAIAAIEAEATAAAEQRLREVERQRDGARQTADELVDRVLDIAVRLGSASDVAAAQLARREWRAKPWASDRALLDTPSPASPRQGEPVEGLDAAWREAEAAIEAVDPGRRLQVDKTPPGLDEKHGEYRAWAVGLDTAWGDTPAAALRALAAALSEPAEP